MSKACCHCGVVKPLSDYGRWCKGKDGYRPKCKECTREAVVKKRDMDKFLAWRKEYIKVRYYEILDEIRGFDEYVDYDADDMGECLHDRELIDRILRGSFTFVF